MESPLLRFDTGGPELLPYDHACMWEKHVFGRVLQAMIIPSDEEGA